jgi:hypothetical protein
MTIPTDLKIILDASAAEHMQVVPGESATNKGIRLESIRIQLKKQIDNWYSENPHTDFSFNGSYYPCLLTPSSPSSSPRSVRIGYLDDCREAVMEGHNALRDARRYCMKNSIQAPYWLTENREVPVTAVDYQRFLQRHCTIKVKTSGDSMTQRDFAILTSLRLTVSPYKPDAQRFVFRPY